MTDPPLRQAAALPFRRVDGGIFFCLITTINGDKWGLPKGVIEGGDTPQQTALREAAEEAGVLGTVAQEPIGSYHQHKWGSTFRVDVYVMEVSRENDDWDERRLRQRRWCDPPTAMKLLEGRPVADIVRRALPELDDGRGQLPRA